MARGDHIYVDRLGGIYSHHGIDCGDGTVIHYWTDELPLRSSVKRTSLAEFAEGGSIRVRGYADCDAPDRVLRRALGSLGARGFDPLMSNCEHFAVWCKTGRRESAQVNSMASFVSSQPGAAALALMFAPVVVPMTVLAVLVGNIIDSFAGEPRR